MTRNARWSAPHRPAARLLVLVGVFLGLFAMHGLGGHGTAGHAVSDTGATQMTLMAHAGDVSHASETAPEQATLSSAAQPDDDGDGAMTMVGLCLAVLLVGLLLLRLLRGPPRGLVFLRGRAPRSAPIPQSAARDPDPPCIYKLSVLRN